MALRAMPSEVRELRDAWASRIADVPHLTEELEKDFRFGQRISKTERGYLMGGTIKGGSSSMWYPSTKEEYGAYLRWRRIEGILEERDDDALIELQEILDASDVRLNTRGHQGRGNGANGSRENAPPPNPRFGFIYRVARDVLRCLPPSHLDRPQLARLQLGGWGPDSAKASAFSNDAVLMYDFAIRGAKRTFIGLFLHELGHAHEHAMSRGTRAELFRLYRVLADADAFLGVEFLIDASTRRLYQKFVFNEFLAETYLIYTACGAELRAFIESLERPVRRAWEQVYTIFRATFDHLEYA